MKTLLDTTVESLTQNRKRTDEHQALLVKLRRCDAAVDELKKVTSHFNSDKMIFESKQNTEISNLKQYVDLVREKNRICQSDLQQYDRDLKQMKETLKSVEDSYLTY